MRFEAWGEAVTILSWRFVQVLGYLQLCVQCVSSWGWWLAWCNIWDHGFSCFCWKALFSLLLSWQRLPAVACGRVAGLICLCTKKVQGQTRCLICPCMSSQQSCPMVVTSVPPPETAENFSLTPTPTLTIVWSHLLSKYLHSHCLQLLDWTLFCYSSLSSD